MITITAHTAHQETACAKNSAGPLAQPIPFNAVDILTYWKSCEVLES